MKTILTAIAVFIACGCSAAIQDTSKTAKIVQALSAKTDAIKQQVVKGPQNTEDTYQLLYKVSKTLDKWTDVGRLMLKKQDSAKQVISNLTASLITKDDRIANLQSDIKDLKYGQDSTSAYIKRKEDSHSLTRDIAFICGIGSILLYLIREGAVKYFKLSEYA